MENQTNQTGDNQNIITFYISIVSGLLLTISEILPYIKSIEGNSITEVIEKFLIKKIPTTPTPTTLSDERTPLVSSQPSNFTITSPNVVFTFNSANVKLDFNE